MSTNNSARASHTAAVNLFGSDGRIESPFRGDWRVAPASSIDFVAQCVCPDGPDRATVNGDLTILGKTQHISFPVRTRLERPNEVAVTGSTTVNRNDYGMSFDKLRASRGLTAVAFSLHLTQQ